MTLAARLEELIAERDAAEVGVSWHSEEPVKWRYIKARSELSDFMRDNEAAILRALKESEHGNPHQQQ